MKAKKLVLVRHFQGSPKDGDVELREEDLPELQEGDVLLEGISWGVETFTRVMCNALSLGDTIVGTQLARIIKSKNAEYPVGKLLVAETGWRTHTVLNPSTNPQSTFDNFATLPTISCPTDTGSLSKSLALGILGLYGPTAYFGLLEISKPVAGETVLVTSAAGTVGSLVGQIAKIKGCKVIGFTGSDDKVKYIKEDLGFDFAYNYKKVDVAEALKEAAPKGIDCYFDNVGGQFSCNVIANHMKEFGRVAICGCTSGYNDDASKSATVSIDYYVMLERQITIGAFTVFRWSDRFPEAWSQIKQWIKEGKIKYREHVTEGFENLYSAFQGSLSGQNIGKPIVNAHKSELTELKE